MATLVVGANGATGRLLVDQLVSRNKKVVAVVRSAEKLPERVRKHNNVTVVQASLLDMSAAEIAQCVKGCDAVVSCLGHNLTFRGLFGHPRQLVTDAIQKLCNVINAIEAEHKTKLILMNTAGNRNRDVDEPISIPHRLVVWLFRHLLPPQADNERAAEHLRNEIGQDSENIEWVVVRPDSLIDEENITEHEEYVSPIRDPIFNAGQTSRINVAHFMTELITNEKVWDTWKGKMPVIYNVTKP